MEVLIPISTILCCIIFLCIGLKFSRFSFTSQFYISDFLLERREIGLVAVTCSMIATFVCICFLNGTSESLYGNFFWGCSGPAGVFLSLIVGGLFFAGKMRSQQYITMLDPFEIKYGKWINIIIIPLALFAEVMWAATIVAALANSFSVFGQQLTAVTVLSCVIIVITVIYTCLGGLAAVVYTDVIQLICIVLGLSISVGFVLASPYYEIASIEKPRIMRPDDWFGYPYSWSGWTHLLDSTLTIAFGAVCYQVYFQRVLACKSAVNAKISSCLAAFGCLLVASLISLIVTVARIADWKQMAYKTAFAHEATNLINVFDRHSVLPLSLRYLTPKWVGIIGFIALLASAISTVDSIILSVSSICTQNIWKLLRQTASDREMLIAARVIILLTGSISVLIAIFLRSVYHWWFLSIDLVYIMLFPQLFCVLCVRSANAYGSVFGFIIAVLIAVTLWGFNIIFTFEEPEYYLPFRTLAMLATLSSIVLVSVLTGKFLPRNLDFFKSREVQTEGVMEFDELQFPGQK